MPQPFELPVPGRIVINIPDCQTLLAETGRRFGVGEGFTLATVNLDHLVKLQHEPVFRTAYCAHDLVVADGNPVVWLSKLAGTPVSLVPGSDMILPFCQQAAALGVTVALVGSTDEVLTAAGADLQRKVPGLEITAKLAPGFGFEPEGAEADEIIAALEKTRPGLVLLALGAPRQERFAAYARDKLPGMGFASIGAGLDFLAGTERRAPRWMRAIAMEWLWRMASNPRRLAKRYFQCAMVLPWLALKVRRRARAQR